MLSLPHLLGYPGLVVLFDETETVLNRGSPRQRQRHLAHVRTFVDHLATGAYRGCAVYYAVAEEFIDTARDDLGALAQRIDRVQAQNGHDLHDRRNPRAVWVDIDELTFPGPRDPRFFHELANRILELGLEAGLDASVLPAIRDAVERNVNSYLHALNEGRVREFVKDTAGMVARYLD